MSEDCMVYEFKHRCSKMPRNVSLVKFADGFNRVEFRYMNIEHLVRTEIVMYDFKLCPYCGKNLEEEQ